MRLVNRVMGNAYVPQFVAGIGVNVPNDVSAARFRAKYGIEGPFVVYVGRVDSAKNVPELLDYFTRFRDETGQDTQLALIGRSSLTLPARPDVLVLGFVSEEDKFDAIRAADVLIMPSLYESLSIVAMEAWLMETPTLVNGHCEVLKFQSRRSNGGLYYYGYDEFAAALKKLLDDAELRAQLGRQGRAFVARHYSWDVIMAKYRALLETVAHRTRRESYG
jgi:glycosyltransferase involved in cell wall biosynthesis